MEYLFLGVNLSNKQNMVLQNSIFVPFILKNPPKTLIVLNPLLTDLLKLSEPEGFQIIEPFICDRLVFIYEDTATKRGFQ